MTRLSRSYDGRPAAPVRMVHLGVGAFARAHPIWFTDHALDGAEWGVAVFTGRSAAVADDLCAQDGLYTLTVRGPVEDEHEVVSAICEAHAGGDLVAWRRLMADPDVAVVTITVTEAGYHRDAHGVLDVADPQVAADLSALRADPTADVRTVPGKLVAGLLVRRAAGAGAIALVPCDNVPDNGAMLEAILAPAAAAVDPSLVPWIGDHVAFVSTMVDRITPRTTADDRAALRAASGVDDPALVVAEPYAEWVLSGDFPAGRPRWESAGARFVEDIEPHESRKLRLLNGAHSLMAYLGALRGHLTVSEAIDDPIVRGRVEAWWDLAAPYVALPAAEIERYRAVLLERFANPRIAHLLAQIAADGSQKLPIRFESVLRGELDGGRLPDVICEVLGAWLVYLRRGAVVDVAAEQVRPLAAGTLETAAASVLARVGISTDARVVREVARRAAELERTAD